VLMRTSNLTVMIYFFRLQPESSSVWETDAVKTNSCPHLHPLFAPGVYRCLPVRMPTACKTRTCKTKHATGPCSKMHSVYHANGVPLVLFFHFPFTSDNKAGSVRLFTDHQSTSTFLGRVYFSDLSTTNSDQTHPSRRLRL